MIKYNFKTLAKEHEAIFNNKEVTIMGNWYKKIYENKNSIPIEKSNAPEPILKNKKTLKEKLIGVMGAF